MVLNRRTLAAAGQRLNVYRFLYVRKPVVLAPDYVGVLLISERVRCLYQRVPVRLRLHRVVVVKGYNLVCNHWIKINLLLLHLFF